MDKSSFKIWEAVKNAYLFLGREFQYMTQIALIPFALQVSTNAYLQTRPTDINLFEAFLYQLPASLFTAWMLFAQTRLILLGERAGRLPQDGGYLADRTHALNLSVVAYMLTNMFSVSAMSFLLWAGDKNFPLPSPYNALVSTLVIGCLIWSLRLYLIPSVLAVGYPARAYMQKVTGPLFSFRLMGMGILSTFPVFILLQAFIELVIDKPLNDAKMSQPQLAVLLVAAGIISVLVPLILNATGVFALKQILGRPEKGARA